MLSYLSIYEDGTIGFWVGGLGLLTVTLQVAVFSPSSVFTVIVDVPAFLAVTLPFETVATLSLELVHVTLVFVALVGITL